jgi:predicted nucleotidyltransferase
LIREEEDDAMLLSAAIAWRYSELPQVEAVALGGSHATGSAEPGSDIDLYVYQREPIPIAVRAEIAEESSLQCVRVPDGMKRDVEALIRALSRGGEEVIDRAEAVTDGLDALLAEEDLLP